MIPSPIDSSGVEARGAMHGWSSGKTAIFALAMVALLGATLSSAVSSVALAAEKDLTDKGEVLVREKCSRCHAVGIEGASPNPDAPPFRTLSSRYPIEDLAESLAEGIVSGHPDMPIFVFGPHDVDAIIAYLESIQEAPAETDETSPADE
ncbi:cytochrome c [Methyloceanibacter superfactus]